MITEYIHAALRRATYKLLEDGSYFGEIPGLQGVWANDETLEGCRSSLQEVLEEWLLLQLRDNVEVPELDGVTLSPKVVEA